MELVTVKKYEGKYYLNSNDDQYQYVFFGLPDEIRKQQKHSFLFPLRGCFDLELPEYGYSALEFAKDLLAIAQKELLWYSNKKDLQFLIKWLEENNEEQEKLWEEKYYNDLSKEKEQLEKRLNKINRILNEKEKKNELE